MNIDNLTFGELKQITAMFGAQQPSAKPHPMVGKYVIARCYAAGVHAGTVESVDGENVILSNSRRLWSWKAADGVALSWFVESSSQYLGEGERRTLLRGVWPDFEAQQGDVSLSVKTRAYPQGADTTKGPFTLPVGREKSRSSNSSAEMRASSRWPWVHALRTAPGAGSGS